MKNCAICKQPKAFHEFNRSTRRKDGLQTHCRDCAKLRSKAYYLANREKHIQATKGRKVLVRLENSRRLKDYLASHPCINCGVSDPVVLRIDRIFGGPGETSISRMIGAGLSWATIFISLGSCVVRCANCSKRSRAQVRDLERGLPMVQQA